MSFTNKDRMNSQRPRIMEAGDIRRLLLAALIIAVLFAVEVGVFWLMPLGSIFSTQAPPMVRADFRPTNGEPTVGALPSDYTGEKRERQHLMLWTLAGNASASLRTRSRSGSRLDWAFHPLYPRAPFRDGIPS